MSGVKHLEWEVSKVVGDHWRPWGVGEGRELTCENPSLLPAST